MAIDIEKLKQEAGVKTIHLFSIEAEEDGSELNAYLREPKLQELDKFVANSEDIAAASRELVNKLWLDGDEVILQNDVDFEALVTQLPNLFQGAVTYKKTLKNLITTYEITVKDSDANGVEKALTCTVRHPKLEELSIQTQRNPVITFQKLLAKLWVNGDTEIRTNVMYLFPVMTKWQKIMDKRVTNVKKL